MHMPVQFWLLAFGLLSPAIVIALYPIWSAHAHKRTFVSTAVATFVIFLGSLALYYPKAFNYEMAQTAQALVEESESEYIKQVADLRLKLEADPNDVALWLQLGEVHADAGRHTLAFSAYDEAERKGTLPHEAQFAYAELIVWSGDSERMDKARQLLDSLLAEKTRLNRPIYLAVLWLSGAVFNEQKKYDLTLRDWRLLLGLLPEDAEASVREQLKNNIREIEQLAESDTGNQAQGRAVRVVVDVAPRFKSSIAEGGIVLVYAKATEGPRMPLAIERLPADELPATITLDGSKAMLEGMSLNEFEHIVVTARISQTGQAVPKSGELFGVSPTLDILETFSTHVEIDREFP